MFGMGWGEILLILIVLMLFVGPERLPDTARSISRAIRGVRKQSRDFRNTLEEDEFLGGAIRDLRSSIAGNPDIEIAQPISPAAPTTSKDKPKLVKPAAAAVSQSSEIPQEETGLPSTETKEL